MKKLTLFEAHLNTANLEEAIKFYENLGLELAYKIEERRVAFFRFGNDKKMSQMLGIWETKEPVIRKHIAFGVNYEEITNSINWLKDKGIEATEDFGLAPIEPLVHTWMPSASVYFSDLDGNSLEFIHVLDGDSAPELGVVYLSEWESRKQLK
ncbi:MAG TPA: VOC family protein [Pseudoneobacillus sp.]|nr:VOC family protein [Pseudoneobacillus sp.]